MELIYHWSTITYATVSFDALQRLGTQHEITQAALQYDFLLHALFALTYLHLASLRPNEAQTLIDGALRYQTKAVSASRQSLENLSASECRAQFQCSVLLGIFALALHCTDAQRTARESPTDALISLAQLWRGTGSIMVVSHELLGSEVYEQIFPPLPLADVEGTAEIDAETNAYVSGLEKLARAAEGSSAIFLEAIARLREVFHKPHTPHAAGEGYVYQILKWPPTIPPEFLDHLYSHETLACAITMVYAVGFRSVEKEWWLQGFSKCLVDDLAMDVMRAKPEWKDVVDWAKAKTSG